MPRGMATTWLVLGVVAAVALAAPLVVPTYYLTLMLPFFAYAIALLGLNLLFGYTGLLSFGHALFVGVGAYTVAFATTRFGIRHMEVILLIAAVAAALIAAPIGALCVRYVKIYFGMLTLAFGMLFYSFLIKFYAITGGDQGLRVAQPYLLGMFQARPGQSVQFLSGPYYYYCAVLLAILGFVMWRVVHSPFGLCLRAIRENPEKAAYLGVNVRRYRWYAFVISAVYAAVGGALLAPVVGNVDPTLAYWTSSGNLVFMTLLGGFTSFFGPLVGAFVFIFLQDRIMTVVPYWRLVFGAILALIVVFAPGGLMGLLSPLTMQRSQRRLGMKPKDSSAVSAVSAVND
jgi:branched-chain amino acid transport system permease protein